MCDAVLHATRKMCEVDDDACMRAQGVYRSKADAPCEHPTECVISGTDGVTFTCVRSATHAQVVHGMGVRGAPSRIVP